jgi:hypothetical protein
VLRNAPCCSGLDRRPDDTVSFALVELAPLAGGLPPETLLGETLGLISLSPLECVKSTSDCLPIDPELTGEIGLMLALANAQANSLDVLVGQFEWRGHGDILLSRGTLRGTYVKVTFARPW